MKLAAAIFSFLIFAGTISAQDETPEPPPHLRELTVPLFNGKDFTGFTFCMKNNADPSQTWNVTNGVIHCTGQPDGYLRTAQTYSNYFLTVEWRFTKTNPPASNTGILIHIQPGDKIWPQSVKVQGRHDRQGDLFLLEGAEAKEHKNLGQNTPVPLHGPSAENALGEWNKAEVVCRRQQVIVFINDKWVNEISDCTLNSGYIGVQNAGADIEIKSIIFSPLKY